MHNNLRNKLHKPLLLLILSLCALSTQAAEVKPNVIFLCIDDLNDWVNCLSGYPGKVYTPNIDKLAKRGLLFTRAYPSSPMCNPSRVALWTGKRPSTTGAYGQYVQWDDTRVETVTMMQRFRNAGYRVLGGGKIFHHGKEVHDDPAFHELRSFHYSGYPKGAQRAGFLRYGITEYNNEKMHDHQLVSWCIDRLNKPQSKPFFMVAGLFRPHSPLWVPQTYFDLYPIEEIVEPEVPAHEMDDIPEIGLKMADSDKRYWPVKKSGKIKEVIQSYLASISFCDAQVGRLVDALGKSEHASNTIIVLWSDHGFHLGEKLHFAKSTLWEESGRIPFIVFDPRTMKEGGICGRPMDSVDIYPTLLDLCDIKIPLDIDGKSFKRLLKDPNAAWKPAVMMLQRNNVAIRSERFRYIRYEDGTEELYDHEKDPHEHKNISKNPEMRATIDALGEYIPKEWAINGLPYPYHKGYIPPLVLKEYQDTQKERQNNWLAPKRYKVEAEFTR